MSFVPVSPDLDRTVSSRRRLWLFRITSAGLSSLIALAILAWFLFEREQLAFDKVTGAIKIQSRPIYLQEPGHELTGHKYLYDPVLGWRNIPNWTATTFGHQLTINSHGLRDREYAYAKPRGWRRILVLGDSFVWGYGVADDEIFTEVLENTFRQEGASWQVINTGVSGWGTDQQLLYLIHEGMKYQPDVVVLGFFLGNDPVNNTSSIQYGLNKPVFLDLSLQITNVPVPKPPADPEKPITAGVGGIELSVRIIAEIEKRCASAGANLVVMKFGLFQDPDHRLLQKIDALFHQRFERLNQQVRYLDLDAEFRDRSMSLHDLVSGNDDGHWNADAHRLVAEILHGFLIDEDLLPDLDATR